MRISIDPNANKDDQSTEAVILAINNASGVSADIKKFLITQVLRRNSVPRSMQRSIKKSYGEKFQIHHVNDLKGAINDILAKVKPIATAIQESHVLEATDEKH